MISIAALAKTALVIGGYFGVRVIARWRVDRRKQAALTNPLVDPILLETVFAPREGDDANLLAEMRDTLAHLNRQAYAEEFFGVSEQICALHHHLPKAARATLRRALVRMLATEDRWLQIVAAKTAAKLKVSETADRLRDLLAALGDGVDDPANVRLRAALSESLEAVEAQ